MTARSPLLDAERLDAAKDWVVSKAFRESDVETAALILAVLSEWKLSVNDPQSRIPNSLSRLLQEDDARRTS